MSFHGASSQLEIRMNYGYHCTLCCETDELDVDALCDKEGNVVIAGIMQHIEQVCTLPHLLRAVQIW